MAKPGPIGKTKKLKILQKTSRPCREPEEIVQSLSHVPMKPVDLTPDANIVWDQEVRKLLARDIDLGGFEAMLRIYCEELAFINREHAKGNTVVTAKINAVRLMGAEFYATPASGLRKAEPKKKKNSFAELGEQTA